MSGAAIGSPLLGGFLAPDTGLPGSGLAGERGAGLLASLRAPARDPGVRRPFRARWAGEPPTRRRRRRRRQ
ncbi:unnamed protein product [Pipistrellus nathusii]|uniref:Uncharacterized protein n=1 Tax=Pipistrellus nathusii TaxID=59473 RepID=A0ABP0A042_PIPNA